jgi:protein-disulfide isomerase
MMWRFALVVLVWVIWGPAAWADAAVGALASSIQPETERTEADRDEIARLLAIARKNQSASRDFSAEFDISAHPFIGPADAPVVMVEFGSYQCGFCRKHFANTLPELQRDYVDTGKLRYVFFDVALDKRHQHAAKAAEAAHCANEQGEFLAYRSVLFRSKKAAAEFLPEHAAAVGLDTAAFTRCLDSQRHRVRPQADRALSRTLRVRGTPSFFLGRLHPDGERVIVNRRIGGARPYALFSKQIDTLYVGIAAEGESEINAMVPEGRQP